MDPLQDAVIGAIRGWPGSRRSLGRAIGVSHTVLNGIVSGSRRTTPDTAKALLVVIEQQAGELTATAEQIRRALVVLEGD
jgi:plasmid maintenance system antidote protein VapI